MSGIRVTAIERVVRIVARGGTGVATINVEAPLTSTGGSTPTLAILPATETTPGTLSAADKAKLNALADPTLSSAVPQPLGNAGPGTSTQAARGDHVHAHGAQAGGGLHSTATTTVAGFMSAADKTKLNGIAANAQVNVPTNLGVGGTGDARTITSSTGTSAALPLATPSTAGLLSTFYATLLANFAGNVRAQVLAMLQQGSNVTLTPGGSGATQTLTIAASGTGGGGSGTVTSVQASGGSTGLTFSGGPITGAGTLTLGGTLSIASGGTGATTAEGARAAIGAGTVTSVGLSLPSIFSVSSSPVTGAGTITATLASQTASRVWASPAGSDGAPTFRELVQGDIPALSASKIVLSDDRLLGQVSGGSAATQIALGTGLSFIETTLTLSTNLQGWHAIAPTSKQDALVSGTNIRTINGNTLLGSTDLVISGGASAAEDVTYDNTASGLAATDVQAAIDQVKALAAQAVVDDAPSIAQEMWVVARNLGSGTADGFNFQQNQMSSSPSTSFSADRAISFVTGAGTTANVWTRYSVTPTWDQRVGSAVYTRRSRAAFVISKPLAAAVAWIHVGSMQSTVSTTVPTFIFGVQKNLSNVWQIVVRDASSVDQITPVTLSISEGQIISVFVEITGNGSNAITGAKIGVFDYLTGVLIDKATWTGSLNVDAQFLSHCLRPVGQVGGIPIGAEELLRIYYQAYGPVPSRATNPFFQQL